MRQVRKYNEEFLQCIKDKRTEIKLIALDLDGTTLKKAPYFQSQQEILSKEP